MPRCTPFSLSRSIYRAAAMHDSPPRKSSLARRQLGFQEGGLVLVVLALGALLSFFGGSVDRPKYRIN
jgi:hypothetical protein